METIITLIAAVGGGALLPSIIKGLFGRGPQREAALLQRESNASKWEEGLRNELRADAEKCMEMNRRLLARVEELHDTIDELKEKVESLEDELARERASRQ